MSKKESNNSWTSEQQEPTDESRGDSKRRKQRGNERPKKRRSKNNKSNKRLAATATNKEPDGAASAATITTDGSNSMATMGPTQRKGRATAPRIAGRLQRQQGQRRATQSNPCAAASIFPKPGPPGSRARPQQIAPPSQHLTNGTVGRPRPRPHRDGRHIPPCISERNCTHL